MERKEHWMMTRARARIQWAALTLSLGAGAAALAQTGKTLIVNGQIASHDVRLIEGRPYVPVADVAKALGQTVVTRAGGYEITAAGGANQIQGLQGKIGDTLFDGKWRFQVLAVEPVDSYTLQNKVTTDYAVYHNLADLTDGVFKPKAGQQLMVARCRLKNGLKGENQALWWASSDTHTALADDRGESYPPIAIDAPEAGPFQSKPLLPGAGIDLAALFAVPEGTQLKDLVFTLRTISEKGKDVRVSLR
jgi:hypothetical protein